MIKKLGHQSITSASSVFLLILFIFAGRILGDVDFGKFSLALAVAFIVESIIDPGFYQITIRDIAIENSVAERYISNVLAYKIIVAPIIILILSMCYIVFSIPPDTKVVITMMVIAGMLKSAKSTYRAALQAYELFHYDALMIASERLSVLLFGVVILYKGGGVIGLCAIFILMRSISFAYMTYMIRRKICNVSLNFNIAFVKNLLMISIPVGLYISILNLYTYVDTLMISIIHGEAEVGWYNAAFRLYEGLSVFPMVICVVFRPQIAKLYSKNRDHFQDLFLRGIKYVIIVALSVSVTGFFIADLAILRLFGQQYSNSINALKILLLGLLFVYVLTYLQMMLISIKKQQAVLYISIIGLIINVIMNLILIPKYGIVGAALATVIGEMMVLGMLMVYVYKMDIEIPIYHIVIKPIGSMVVPMALWNISAFSINVYMAIIVINTIYVYLLWQLKVFRIDDIQFLHAYRDKTT